MAKWSGGDRLGLQRRLETSVLVQKGRSHEEPMDGVRLEFEQAALPAIGQPARALPAEQLTVE